MSSVIFFVRHGITEGNVKNWYYGQADLHLAKEGIENLKQLVKEDIYPKMADDTDYYTSGLIRTEETFKIIFGDKEHKQIKKLQEMNFGDFECRSYEELKDNKDFLAWAYDETGEIAMPNGESRNHFNKRISEGLKELRGYHRLKELSHRHSGKDAHSTIICHGGVISAMMSELFPGEKENMWQWIPEPGRGYMVTFEKGDPVNYSQI